MIFKGKRGKTLEGINRCLVFKDCNIKNLLIEFKNEGAHGLKLEFVSCRIENSRVKFNSDVTEIEGDDFSVTI